MIMISWQSSIHFSFIQMNSRKDCHLFFRWISISNELPAQKGSKYRVVGLSRKENDEFWIAEHRFNQLYYRLANIGIHFACTGICVQYFLVSFDIDFYLFILIQGFHIVYSYVWFYLYFHCICDPSVFYLWTSKFLTKKFSYISRQIGRMNAKTAKTKIIDNRKLSSLIRCHNRVMMELFEVNAFFKVCLPIDTDYRPCILCNA